MGGSLLQVVNDEPISSYDVDARLRLVAASAGQPIPAEDLPRLRRQILQTLIDERLQLQEAERLEIKVSNQEIQAAIRQIEEQNNLPEGRLVELLTANDVDISTLVAQIRSTLTWRKLIGRRTQANVQIAESDIDAYLQNLQAKGGTEWLLGEIFIAADNPADLPRTRAIAQSVLDQARQGATFTDLAKQFSQAPTAGAGGDTGWIQPDQLDRPLAEAVRALSPGQITPPVGVEGGYYLLALRDTRTFGKDGRLETVMTINRLFFPYPRNASNRQKRLILDQLQHARGQLRNCASIERIAIQIGDPQKGTLGQIRPSDLPTQLRPVAEELPLGQPSQVLPLTDGGMVMMICSRETRTLGLPQRDEVREQLLQQRANLMARRYLRELRQQAVIDDFTRDS